MYILSLYESIIWCCFLFVKVSTLQTAVLNLLVNLVEQIMPKLETRNEYLFMNFCSKLTIITFSRIWLKLAWRFQWYCMVCLCQSPTLTLGQVRGPFVMPAIIMKALTCWASVIINCDRHVLFRCCSDVSWQTSFAKLSLNWPTVHVVRVKPV